MSINEPTGEVMKDQVEAVASVSSEEDKTAPQSVAVEQTISESEDLSFAEMFAEQERDGEKQPRLIPGQRVSARIVAITTDTVFVSTGTKVDGIVEREELEENGELTCVINDVIDLYVISVTSQEVKLSKVVRGTGSIIILESARDAGLPVEGTVTAQIKGGYAVDLMKRRAFCPASQIALRPLDDAASVIGKTLPFIVTKIDKGGRDLVVSRRMLLEREQAENIEKVLEGMHEGDVVEATVTRFAPFGAFVEIALGVEGLVHLSELSWVRVAQADEVASIGDRIRVKVLSIEKTEKGMRFSLSAKAVTEDPWHNAAERLSAGEVITGKVVRLAPFGAFVEVIPGVEGLVHLSEFSYEKRIMKADEVVAVGDVVPVKIKDIDTEKKRISLSIREAAGDPWATIEESFIVGQEVIGTLEKRATFGMFISVAPGITGLLPASTIQASASRKALERLSAGEPVPVTIRQIDVASRRISLAPAGEELKENQAEEKNWREHTAPKAAPKPSMGALGFALQSAMKSKKQKK